MKKLVLFLLLGLILIGGAGCTESSSSEDSPPQTSTSVVESSEKYPDASVSKPAERQLKFPMEDCSEGNSKSDFWVTLQKLETGETPVGNLNAFVFDDVTMHVSFEKAAADTDNRDYICMLTGLTAENQAITVNPPLQLCQSHEVSLFKVDGMYVFSSLLYGCGDTYIFHDGGIFEQHNSCDLSKEASQYNDDIVVFTKGENGQLKYVCYPRKFTGLVSVGKALTYLTDRREQFLERGFVTFEEEIPIFTKEESLTISQVWNLEAEFDAAKKMFPSKYKNVQTLDALIAENAAKYKKYVCHLARSLDDIT